MEFVAGGGVEAVLKNANESDPEDALGRHSYAVLSLVADTAMGRRALLEQQAIEKSLARLPSSTCILYTYFILRFLEVCSQHENTVRSMVKVRAVASLVDKYLFFSKQSSLQPLCIPCLQAIKNILLDYRDILKDHMAELQPLKQKWQHTAYLQQKNPSMEKKTHKHTITRCNHTN